MKCPRCQQAITSDASSCSDCGFSFNDATQKFDSVEPSPRKSSEKKSFSSPNSIDDARFVPGTILGDRYRIVGLLGKGGMGEVYRADDLKLSQPVALKFLPEHMLRDGAALARFHREVRVARQVSHKNVCRVYDIGEADGRHFLSMEFIKGEELSSLIRRIGRLPQDKAIQLARQICAGLAAAHDIGFLHRDLKPSNVMIDGDGNARILDFGLGGLTDEFAEEEIRAGTPAYMSPEQIEGKAQTIQSDIYSLGVLLYELFTGKKAFDAASLNELIQLRRSDTTPTTPTSIVEGLDPLIEKIIDRCMAKDPASRPSSALQVAASLPGGDPLAAALAAGETPSPEMVAAAPKKGGLRPAIAISVLALYLFGLVFVIVFAGRAVLHGYASLEKSPEVLRENAREIIQTAGVTAATTDRMHWFAETTRPVEYLARHDRRPDRWQQLRDGQPTVVHYYYRQSPAYIGGFEYFRNPWTNPAPIVAGMAGVRLDMRGRLLEFYTVPPQVDPVSSSAQSAVSSAESRVSSSQPTPGSQLEARNSKRETTAAETPNSERETTFDWSRLFQRAGFDISKFKPTSSQWAPLYGHDQRSAWEGVFPEQPDVPIRVESASYRGQPVYFEVIAPWDNPERQQPSGLPIQIKVVFTILLIVFVLVLVGSVLLALRNLRQGRGDRKGAWRLGAFMFTATLLTRLSTAHHVPTFEEFGVVFNSLQDSLFAAAFSWLMYLALEPLVRRRWPHRIVSWTRLLNGDFRDPLVGRDVLLGALFGIAIAVWQIGFYLAREQLGDPNLIPNSEPSTQNLGIGYFVPAMFGQLSASVVNSFQVLFLVLLLALSFRRDWIGFVAGWVVFAAVLSLLWGGTLPNWISAFATAGVLMFALIRFGLLNIVASIFFLHMHIQFPVTFRLTEWYAAGFLIDLVLVLALAIWAFYVSLAGQRLSGRIFAES